MNEIVPEIREIKVYKISLTEKTLVVVKGHISEREFARITNRLARWIKSDDPMFVLNAPPDVEIILEKVE